MADFILSRIQFQIYVTEKMRDIYPVLLALHLSDLSFVHSEMIHMKVTNKIQHSFLIFMIMLFCHQYYI